MTAARDSLSPDPTRDKGHKMNHARLVIAEAMISVAYFQCWVAAKVVMPRSQQPVSTYIEGRTKAGRRRMVEAIRASRLNA